MAVRACTSKETVFVLGSDTVTGNLRFIGKLTCWALYVWQFCHLGVRTHVMHQTEFAQVNQNHKVLWDRRSEDKVGTSQVVLIR